VGEIIDAYEMSKRIRRYGRDPNHKHHYLMALRSGTVIDATQQGNESRFINHSCEPNAVIWLAFRKKFSFPSPLYYFYGRFLLTGHPKVDGWQATAHRILCAKTDSVR
jgi:hypothetical protein